MFFLLLTSCNYLEHAQQEKYERIANEVLQQDLPPLITAKTGRVNNNNIKIWYEVISPTQTPKATVLLISGLGTSALGWSPDFYLPFVSAGFEVIRIDHRDVGLSSWTAQDSNYSLQDMADDVAAIVRHFKIKKVHLIGQSMGGMIAQLYTFQNKEKVKTLTLIYSSANMSDTTLLPNTTKTNRAFSKVYKSYGRYKNLKNQVRYKIANADVLKGNEKDSVDLHYVAQSTHYEIKKRKGFNNYAPEKHKNAMDKSGSRYVEFKKLNVPIMLVHGKEDPIIPISHSYKMQELQPKAQYVWVDNMGHHLSPNFIKTNTSTLIGFLVKQEETH